MNIKQISPGDVPDIAAIHLASFPKDHLTAHFPVKMLTAFLLRLISFEIYNIVIKDSQNRVAGYLIAGYNYGKALKYFAKEYYLSVIKVLLFSPSFIPYKLKNFFIKKPGAMPIFVTLDIIAVNPLLKNQGIGSMLLKHFEEMLLRDNIREYILYVKKNNIPGVNFYKKRGFSLYSSMGGTFIMLKKI